MYYIYLFIFYKPFWKVRDKLKAFITTIKHVYYKMSNDIKSKTSPVPL